MSDCLDIKLVLNRVGQGLFYSGTIGDFNFVYDCGSEETTHKLKSIIEDYKKEISPKHLNLLVISHFDTDHVSGLDELLAGLTVDYVVMPYLLPVERLTLALENPNADDWYHQFLADPLSYLLGKDVRTVVIVGGGEEAPGGEDRGRGGPKMPDNESPTNLSESIYDISLEMPRDEETQSLVLRHEPTWREYLDNKLLIRNHKGRLDIGWIWLFRFFNCRADTDKINDLVNCVRETIGCPSDEELLNEKIRELIANRQGGDKLRSCYARAFGKDLNVTSLIAYHGPTARRYMNCQHFVLGSEFNAVFLPRANCMGPALRTGYFLTGDIDLRPKWTEVENHFASYFGYMSGILIPHHGSKRSWDRHLMGKLSAPAIWYLSAGIGNRHGHPSPEVIREILQSGQRVFWSNQFCEIREYWAYLPHR